MTPFEIALVWAAAIVTAATLSILIKENPLLA